jgi:hypothetical protein
VNVAFRFAVLACAALALAACGRSATYRYKLTLSLDTPDGVKTGFNVVEARSSEVSIPARGVTHATSGQGIYVDLGPGRRPLIALLTHIRRANEQLKDIRWDEDDPTDIFRRLCLRWSGRDLYKDRITEVTAIGDCGAPFAIASTDLPDLVTFADVNNPNSVVLVDPNNLSATLGPGVAWRSMTLQATDEPLTRGIDEHLPWVRGYQPNIPLRDLKSDEGLHDFVNKGNFLKRD